MKPTNSAHDAQANVPNIRPHSPPADASRPRILIVASTLHVGGAERIMACLAKNIDRSRFDVRVCFLKENGVVGAEMARDGITVLPLPGFVAGRLDRLTWLKLHKLIKQERIDLIHTHDVHGFTDGSLCRLRMPTLRHVHTFHWGNYPQRDFRDRIVERLLWRVPDELVAVGHEQMAGIRSLYPIPEKRIKVIWNGVDAPIANLAEEVRTLTQNTTVPIIASISTLIPQKGLHHLLDVAHRLKSNGAQFKLLIVGHGHLRAALEKQCQSLQLSDCVHFLGWITEASQRALPACDIFVQSSLWEAMSVVVLEAMACGKPVVVTRVGENIHVIEDGVSGRTVPKGDPQALADALLDLLNDSTQRQRLGEAARARHASQFTVQHMIGSHEDLYLRLLTSGDAG